MRRIEKIELPIPEQIKENTSSKLAKSRIFGGTYIVSTYSGNCNFTFTRIKDRSVTSKVSSEPFTNLITYNFPNMYYLTDTSLEGYNVRSNVSSKFKQTKGVKSNVRGLVSSDKRIVGIGINSLFIWDIDNLSKNPEPEEFETTDYQDICGQINSVSDFSTIINNKKVIVINTNLSNTLFQVWDVEKKDLVGWSEYPAKAEGKSPESFLTFSICEETGIMVGTCRSNMYIWNLNDEVDERGQFSHRTIKFSRCMITAVHLDKDFIIAGDNNGNLTLLNQFGQDIYCLNNVPKSAISDTDIENIPISQLSVAFKNKVNRITRVGRWVIASFDNGHMEMYDIFSPDLTAPVDEYINQTAGGTGGVLRELCLSGGRIMATYSGGKDPKTDKLRTKPDVVVWTPKTESEGFELFAEQISGMSVTPSANKIIETMLDKMAKKIGSFEEYKDYKHQLTSKKNANFTRKVVPFYLSQKVVENLDTFEQYLLRVSKSGNVSKYKEYLEECSKQHRHFIELAAKYNDFIGDNARFRTDGKSGAVRYSEAKTTRIITRFESAKPVGMASGRAVGADGFILGSGLTVNEMLATLNDALKEAYGKIVKLVEGFDIACNAGIHDPEKVEPLLRVYTKLCQMREDIRETGKEISDMRSTTTSVGTEWFGNGGEYNEVVVPPSSVPSLSL